MHFQDYRPSNWCAEKVNETKNIYLHLKFS